MIAINLIIDFLFLIILILKILPIPQFLEIIAKIKLIKYIYVESVLLLSHHIKIFKIIFILILQ